MSPEEEAAIRADERLKVLRKVHLQAKLVDEWPGSDGRNIVDMIEGLIRQAEADRDIPDQG